MIPTSYTVSSFAEYIADEVLGHVADVLEWDTTDDLAIYEDILDEALLQLGYTDVSSVSGDENIRKLRMFGRIEAWRKVQSNSCGDINMGAEGGNYQREQVFVMAGQQLDSAEGDYVYEFEQDETPVLRNPYSSYSGRVKVGW